MRHHVKQLCFSHYVWFPVSCDCCPTRSLPGLCIDCLLYCFSFCGRNLCLAVERSMSWIKGVWIQNVNRLHQSRLTFVSQNEIKMDCMENIHPTTKHSATFALRMRKGTCKNIRWCHRFTKQSGELSLGKLQNNCTVGLGLIYIAAIRASKRAETKVISDLAARSESWWQLKSFDQLQFQLNRHWTLNNNANKWKLEPNLCANSWFTVWTARKLHQIRADFDRGYAVGCFIERICVDWCVNWNVCL